MSNIILTTPGELEALIQQSVRKVINEGKMQPPEGSKEILSITEAGTYLNLAKQTLYGFTSKNLIPFIKRGKKLYFRKSDLDRWLMQGKQLTKEEIEVAGFEGLKNKKGGTK